jgi:ankyrin repeat protein
MNHFISIMKSLAGAIQRHHLPKVKTLLDEYPALFREEISFGWPVLHECLANSVEKTCADLELVKRFIQNGGDINQRTYNGVSLLFLARLNRPCLGDGIAEHLAALGGNLSTFETAALTIVEGDDTGVTLETIASLLDREPALIRTVGHEGYTLLHHAACHWRPQIVGLLLDRGADPNALNHDGDTPLLLTRNGEGVLALHQKVAQENATWRKRLMARSEEMYALVEAAEQKLREGQVQQVLETLRTNPNLIHAWYPPRGQFLHWAAWRGCDCELPIKYMLEHGVDPNVPATEGKTALHFVMERPMAASGESLKLIRLLVQSGADIDRRDKYGRTPIHEARVGQEELVKALIGLGADVNAGIGGFGGETILDLVRERDWGDRELSRWLKERGARSSKAMVPAEVNKG